MIKKENKIIVVVEQDHNTRRKMMAALAVRLGFAMIRSDALKIIKESVFDLQLSTSYFVMVSDYNFRGRVATNQKLYEMAARGILVMVGVKSLPREYEIIAQVVHREDLV